jgi:hypothetical protein
VFTSIQTTRGSQLPFNEPKKDVCMIRRGGRGGEGRAGCVPIKAKPSTISRKCWDTASLGYETNWINNFTCACTMHSSDIHSHNFHDVYVQAVPKVFTRITVRIEIFTALTINCAVCWVVTPCGPVEIYRRIRGTYCLHLQGTSLSRT